MRSESGIGCNFNQGLTKVNNVYFLNMKSWSYHDIVKSVSIFFFFSIIWVVWKEEPNVDKMMVCAEIPTISLLSQPRF